ncbi:hypothetical protein Pmani_002237 [Petrolisthes manimaculis]|uniref:Uncharacterized protein n=1 Tax=Petrolisthes manimaculis TaxID=1843537 RepID=A0AAE1QJ07_9EUCA|nr:hypothetical protein Pmani_002237 [Petrolisthes manimaculis]
MALGEKAYVEAVLLHRTLRNVLSAVYLAIKESTRIKTSSNLMTETQGLETVSGKSVMVYWRCLYCISRQITAQAVALSSLTPYIEGLDDIHKNAVIFCGLFNKASYSGGYGGAGDGRKDRKVRGLGREAPIIID